MKFKINWDLIKRYRKARNLEIQEFEADLKKEKERSE